MAGLNEPTPEDLAHIAQIEAETEAAAQAEGDALLIGMAPYLLMGGCFVLLLLSPLLVTWLGAMPFGNTSGFTAWLWLAFPLLVYAALVFHCGRFRMPGGKVYEGWKVRAGALLAVAVSFGVFWVRLWEAG